MRTLEKVTLIGTRHGDTATFPVDEKWGPVVERLLADPEAGMAVYRRWLVYVTDGGYPLGRSRVDLDG